nr:dienelactone hydrolase family protein [Candidatus Levybacteria bacterium]
MEKLIKIKVNDISLEGILNIPKGARGIVLFAHGSGSSRLSPRNSFVAKFLQDGKLGTLLIDLLTSREDEVYENRFDINLLTERLTFIINWLHKQEETKNFAIGLFGSSTGAAAAIKAAAVLGSEIKGVVSRGGRPDLALDVIDKVVSPTLLIVGGNDFGVIGLNEDVYNQLRCEKKIEIIERATHLFEEPGTLEKVSEFATDWFKKYLV